MATVKVHRMPTDSAERTVAGIKLLARTLDGVAAKDLKGMADEFKAKLGSGVVALVAVADGKASLVVAVSADLKIGRAHV